MTITRRDFLNGMALTVASGLTPEAQLAAQPSRYPPALMGMRGSHAGSFETMHALAREKKSLNFASRPFEEAYDLIVVGAGISGLSAAWFYKQEKPNARILILDNHDDFGGHAKRNEFMLDGRRIIGYGGSQSLQSPNSLYKEPPKRLLRQLSVDIKRFETAFDRSLYPSLGLSRGIFFPKENFGRDVLVQGDPSNLEADETARRPENIRSRKAIIADFPISEASKNQLLELYAGTRDPLAGKSAKEKREFLEKTSYRDFLIKAWGCNEEVANCFQGRSLGFFGLGIDSVAADDLRDLGYPGFAGLKIQGANAAWKEPYIYHFPDGNAALPRMLVRALIPGVAPGSTMDDVVLAAFDYSKLDEPSQRVRVRLDSTVVDVRNEDDEVQVAYVRNGTVHRAKARHAVLACFHMVIPHIMKELSSDQRAALAKNVKTPICYTNVLVRDWKAMANLKVSNVSAPMSFHHQVSLDFPVSMGGYNCPRDPSEPMVLHLACVPGAPNQGLDARTQFRIGQGKLYVMTFQDFEDRIRDDLDRMLGPGGFSSSRDIAAITVNRWPHGYSYVENSLFDQEDDYERDVLEVARETVGNVAIANTDAGGDAWVHFAVEQADRAVKDLLT
jgi:spermidine dehydrogenase